MGRWVRTAGKASCPRSPLLPPNRALGLLRAHYGPSWTPGPGDSRAGLDGIFVASGLTMGSAASSACAGQLEQRIARRQARVGITGLGYVGLPLAVEFARVGFSVTGFDVSASKVAQINAGESYVLDVPSDALQPLVASGRLHATEDFSALGELDTVNICVPTPGSVLKVR